MQIYYMVFRFKRCRNNIFQLISIMPTIHHATALNDDLSLKSDDDSEIRNISTLLSYGCAHPP